MKGVTKQDKTEKDIGKCWDWGSNLKEGGQRKQCEEGCQNQKGEEEEDHADIQTRNSLGRGNGKCRV